MRPEGHYEHSSDRQCSTWHIDSFRVATPEECRELLINHYRFTLSDYFASFSPEEIMFIIRERVLLARLSTIESIS